MNQGEIVIYQAIDNTNFQLDVKVENETVWLNRHQIAILFDRDIKTIGKHITNAIAEELQNISVVAKFATTASDGKIYQVEHYNLDVIISVGYRVKSHRGIQFRIWASQVLKNYLLKGYAINQRIEKLENKVHHLEQKSTAFDFHIRTSLPPHEGIFFEGQIFDAYQLVSSFIKEANTSIILIDNYVDETILTLLSKHKKGVKTTIFTKKITKQLALDITKHNKQYEPIEAIEFTKAHDRFLIIDEKIIYHIGASLKDLGKKWFAFSKIEINPQLIINELHKAEKKYENSHYAVPSRHCDCEEQPAPIFSGKQEAICPSLPSSYVCKKDL